MTQVSLSNDVSIGSSVFAQLTRVPNTKQTDKLIDTQTTVRATWHARIYALHAGDAA